MNIEISGEAFRVTLFGYGGAIDDGDVPASGKRLMDRMWRDVRAGHIKTKGISHWVYLSNSAMFTGVELTEPTTDIGTLEKLDVSLERYLRHVHVGPYATLPQIWPLLFSQLKERDEVPRCPNLEVYGHWNEDPSKCETTILIGLDPRQ